MVTHMSVPAFGEYAKILAAAAGDAAISGAWVLAGELPPRKRRLARVGMTAMTAAIGAGLSAGLEPPSDEDPRPAMADAPSIDPEEDEADEQADEQADDRVADPIEAQSPALRPLFVIAASGIPVAIMIGSSFLQKRWLAGRTSSGHPHPHRSLAVRVAAVAFAGTLVPRLLEAWAPSSTPEVRP
jgi:hypothetical protein